MKVHFSILNCGLARESFSTDNPYMVTCARCLRELDKMREGKLADKPLYIHIKPRCAHEWTEEVIFDQGASAKCGKCGQLAINEDWAG